MNLSEYLKDECAKATLNENTSQIGYTDVFSGSNYMGPHRHDYIIWNEFGYGYTSDAIAAPDCKGQASVGGHIHQIVDGKVWPAGDGHTHTLNTPFQIADDVHIGDAKNGDPTGTPMIAPNIILNSKE